MPAADALSGHSAGSDSPARRGQTIVPHDTNELARVTRGIYVGVAGDIVLTTIGGDTLTFKNAPAGSVLPVQAKIVKSTGTTATDLVGLD